MPNYDTPYHEITLDGVPWSQADHGGVVESIEIDDEEGSIPTVRVTISGLTVDQMGSEIYRAGTVIGIRLGYSDNLWDWGTYRVTQPRYQFGAMSSCQVMLECEGKAAALAEHQRYDIYQNQTYRQIVTAIADRYGFTAYFGKEGGAADDPFLDKSIGTANNTGQTDFAFLKTLANSCGRYVHVDDEQIYFTKIEDDTAKVSSLNENGLPQTSLGGGASVSKTSSQKRSSKIGDSIGRSGSELGAEILSGRLSSSKSQASIVDPYADTRGDLSFVWNEASQDPGIFNIWNIQIRENFRNKGKGTEGSLVDEDSKETATEAVEPEESDLWLALTEKGELGKYGTSPLGGLIMGLEYTDRQGGKTGKFPASQGAPKSRKEVRAQKKEQKRQKNKAQSKPNAVSTKSGGTGAGMVEDIRQSVDEAFREQLGIDPGIKYQPDSDGTQDAVGLAGGDAEDLKNALQSEADASQYGVFISFDTFGVPGVKARRAFHLNNLSRWSGKTYARRVTHRYSTSSGYITSFEARAPGTFAPTSGTGADNSKTENPNSEDAADNAINANIALTVIDPKNPGAGTLTAREGTLPTGKKSYTYLPGGSTQ